MDRGAGQGGRQAPPAPVSGGVDGSEALQRRADAFRLLAACFYVPDKEAFLEEDLCGSLAALVAEFCPEAAEAAREMGRALEATGEEDLRVDHAGLFLGPFELEAPPYGSVYLEKTKRLMGDSTMEVKAAYREHGLEVVEREAPDHIAIELEFLHYLWSLAARARDDGDGEEATRRLTEGHRFLTAFLAPWVPEFSRRIRESARTGFYARLSECLEQCIRCAARHRGA